MQKLLKDTNFKSKIGTEWQRLRENILSNAYINDRIETLKVQLIESQVRNFVKWNIIGKYGK